MDKKKLDRISELTAISRQRKLTEAETAERESLRNEYRAAVTGSLLADLENTVIINPDGSRQKVSDRRRSGK